MTNFLRCTFYALMIIGLLFVGCCFASFYTLDPNQQLDEMIAEMDSQ